MKLIFDDLEMIFDNDFLPVEEPEEPLEFLFDDEPLESILYGKNPSGPTLANLFWPASQQVRKIIQAYREKNLPRVLKNISEFEASGYLLSIKMCFDLAGIIESIVPNYPLPVIKFDLSALGPPLENMWRLALSLRERALQEKVGRSLFRWYEHRQQYQSAREVLSMLIEIYQEQQDRFNEAVMLNNFAFEYLLEGRWEEAAPHFERAANIFSEIGDSFDHANSRANYWICRFECGSPEDLKKIEAELKTLKNILAEKRSWHARKPLILLARIEERRGKINEAIRLVARAIESAKGSKTQYPELDRKYLEDLKRILDSGVI